MVVHTDQGLRETTILNVKCEGGLGDWGGGSFNSEHNSVLLFLSLFQVWQVTRVTSLLSLACTYLNLNIVQLPLMQYVYPDSQRDVVSKYMVFYFSNIVLFE